MVYTVKSDDVLSLINADRESLQIQAILPMTYESLVSAEFVTEKGTYTLEKQVTSADTAESTEQTADEVQADEAEKARKDLWSQVTALKASGSAEDRQGEQVLSIHAVNTDGKECTVVFREYSAEYYLVIEDGGKPRTVSADAIDAIVRAVRSLR